MERKPLTLAATGVRGVDEYMEETEEDGGGGKQISHASKQFVMSHLLFQIWQEMHKQSVPLNDDNSTFSTILQGVWESLPPALRGLKRRKKLGSSLFKPNSLSYEAVQLGRFLWEPVPTSEGSIV